ncbi:MAG: hypothetical protein JWM78_3071 [Verrucomicrobiaceae bacterium]|nr:hypothetical protein [Verrucomicrobiaceae bacterium]
MDQITEDKATLRRLGFAVLGMCGGALCLVVFAIVMGRFA